MTKIEYEITKKEYKPKHDFLFLGFNYWIDGEKYAESMSIPSSRMDNWEKEIEKFLRKFETLSEKETKGNSIVDKIVLNNKKEMKKKVVKETIKVGRVI